ncbi:hypothetical protein ACJW30_02G011700 [Castanea mollissima]
MAFKTNEVVFKNLAGEMPTHFMGVLKFKTVRTQNHWRKPASTIFNHKIYQTQSPEKPINPGKPNHRKTSPITLNKISSKTHKAKPITGQTHKAKPITSFISY